jgi:transposase
MRHSPEQIEKKLRDAYRLHAEGMSVREVAETFGVSERTYRRWLREHQALRRRTKRPGRRPAS